MKFTVIASGKYSIEWPIIELIVNGKSCGTAEITEYTVADFDIELLQEKNVIEILYTNKKEHHTVVNDSCITSDQSLEIQKIRINDILLDNWFLTQGYYYPDYFAGFLERYPLADKKLKSQLVWHFPGKFIFETVPKESNFWFWYRNQRRYIHIKKYSEKDGYREENYIGSFDPLTDLINEIKRLINV